MANETITTTPGDNVEITSAGRLTSTQSDSTEPILISTRTFTCNDGYYYKRKPVATIQSQTPNRYSVVEFDLVYDGTFLTSISFKIYFTFITLSIPNSDGDVIKFSSYPITKPIVVDYTAADFTPTVRKVFLSTPLRGSGDSDRILTVEGDPGSTFDVYIKNSAGEYYDFNGNFITKAVYHSIIIPHYDEVNNAFDYLAQQGIYKENFSFPPETAGTTYVVSILTKGKTQAKGVKTWDTIAGPIAGAFDRDITSIPGYSDESTILAETVYPTEIQTIIEHPETIQLTFEAVHNLAGTTYSDIGLPDDAVYGPFEVSREVNQEFNISWVVTDADKLSTPTLNTEDSIEWGSETDNLTGAVGSGNDLVYIIQGSEEAKGWEIEISAITSAWYDSEIYVTISGMIHKTGTESLTSKLIFNNFISVST